MYMFPSLSMEGEGNTSPLVLNFHCRSPLGFTQYMCLSSDPNIILPLESMAGDENILPSV